MQFAKDTHSHVGRKGVRLLLRVHCTSVAGSDIFEQSGMDLTAVFRKCICSHVLHKGRAHHTTVSAVRRRSISLWANVLPCPPKNGILCAVNRYSHRVNEVKDSAEFFQWGKLKLCSLFRFCSVQSRHRVPGSIENSLPLFSCTMSQGVKHGWTSTEEP